MMPGLSGIDVLKIVRETHDMAEPAGDHGHGDGREPHDRRGAQARAPTTTSPSRSTFRSCWRDLARSSQLKKAQDELAIRNEFIRQTFGRYLSDEIVESLLETPEGLKLGGEKRKVTIMMSDVRGFTSLCERLPPERRRAHAQQLSRRDGPDHPQVSGDDRRVHRRRHPGASSARPILRDDDAARAIACAIEMQLAMERVNACNAREGMPRAPDGYRHQHRRRRRRAISAPRTRAKYGVVGSPVNLTARIESYTVGGQILISGTTIAEISECAAAPSRSTRRG